MPAESKHKSKFDWAGWSCVLGVIVIIALLVATPVLRQQKLAKLTEATSNARHIGLALLEFEYSYVSYPNAATFASIAKKHPSHINYLFESSSNAIFRQLLVQGLPQAEQMFYARIPGTIRPDGIITPGEALKKGECAFSYISGLSSKDDPLTPIVITPLIPGTTKFDPKPFNGKAVILHIDNSVRHYDIHKDGHVYDKGINLLSPKHTVWKGKAPDIRYPE
jgi:hypothetical protein